MMFKNYARIGGNVIQLRSSISQPFGDVDSWLPTEARNLAARLVELAEQIDAKLAEKESFMRDLEEIDVNVSALHPGGPTWEDVAEGLIAKGYGK